MSKRRHLLPVIMVGATALSGCDDGKSDANEKKDTPKADTTKDKDEPEKDPPKTDPPQEDPPQDDGADGNDQPPKEPPKTIIIHDETEIPPMRLGGAPMPVREDPAEAELGAVGSAAAAAPKAADKPAPATPPAAAPAAPAPASPEPAADAEPAPADGRVALAIVHNHPPGEDCTPLSQDEVRKALADLQGAK